MAFKNLDGWHVKLDGKGYLLTDESYAIQAQRAFNPRFSTGDPNLGDLSFWQFLGQESFKGSGQRDFTDKTLVYQANGWDLAYGRPRLSFGQQTPALANAPSKSNFTKIMGKFVEFWGQLWLCYRTSGIAGTETTILNKSVANNVMKVTHLDVHNAVRFNRSGQPTPDNSVFLATCYDNFIKIFARNSPLNAVYIDTVGTASMPASARLIIPIAADIIMVIGVKTGGTAQVGGPIISIWKFDAGAWSVVAGWPNRIMADLPEATNSALYEVAHGHAVDKDGTIYFAMTSLTDNDLRPSSYMIRMVAGDAVAQPTITAIDPMNNYVILGVLSLGNGSAYYYGYELEGMNARLTIRKWPGTTIWSSSRIVNLTGTNGTFPLLEAAHHNTFDHALILARNDINNWMNVMRIDLDETVKEVHAVPQAIVNTSDAFGLCVYSGSFYLWQSEKQQIYVSNLTRGQLPSGTLPNADLQFSRFGANTPLIQKSLYKIKVELSEPVPADDVLQVFVNSTLIGTVTSVDDTVKELVVPSEISGPWFQPILRFDKSSRWTGYLVRLGLQYVPIQLKKRAWSFSIRLDQRQRNRAGTGARTPDAMRQELEAVWSSNRIIELIDVDGRTYNVVKTDFKGRRPLLGDDVKRPEYAWLVELLEV